MHAQAITLLTWALAYLVGAVPHALLLARIKGVDIRRVGSGNIGATNVFRSVSRTLGVLTFVLDALKGFVPAFFFPGWVAQLGGPPAGAWTAVGCGVAAFCGHNWPIYIGFKGGKGVATSAGVLLGLAPAAVGIGAATWLLLFRLTGYVSVASIGAALAVPVGGWWLYPAQGPAVPVMLTVLGAVVVLRHRANIQRLLNGTEHRFQKKDKHA